MELFEIDLEMPNGSLFRSGKPHHHSQQPPRSRGLTLEYGKARVSTDWDRRLSFPSGKPAIGSSFVGMVQLIRSILQRGVLYFLVMMGLHFAMLLFTIIGKAIEFLLLTEGWILTSRRSSLPLSLRLWSRCTYFTLSAEFVANPDLSV